MANITTSSAPVKAQRKPKPPAVGGTVVNAGTADTTGLAAPDSNVGAIIPLEGPGAAEFIRICPGITLNAKGYIADRESGAWAEAHLAALDASRRAYIARNAPVPTALQAVYAHLRALIGKATGVQMPAVTPEGTIMYPLANLVAALPGKGDRAKGTATLIGVQSARK